MCENCSAPGCWSAVAADTPFSFLQRCSLVVSLRSSCSNRGEAWFFLLTDLVSAERCPKAPTQTNNPPPHELRQGCLQPSCVAHPKLRPKPGPFSPLMPSPFFGLPCLVSAFRLLFCCKPAGPRRANGAASTAAARLTLALATVVRATYS